MVWDKWKPLLKRWILDRASPEMMLLFKHLAFSRSPVYFPLYHKTVNEKDASRAKVLIVSPHPDDEVFGMGGTLSMHLAAGSTVLVLYMSTGDKSDPNRSSSEMMTIRRREARSLGEKLGLEQIFWDYGDLELAKTQRTTSDLNTVLKEFRPDSIYLPSLLDAHKDHFISNLILADALRANKNSDAAIYGFEIWTDIPFPNHIFDITEHYEKKMEMFSMYQSQLSTYNYERLCYLRNALNYTKYVNNKGKGFAEAFVRLPVRTFVNVADDLERIVHNSERTFGDPSSHENSLTRQQISPSKESCI